MLKPLDMSSRRSGVTPVMKMRLIAPDAVPAFNVA